RHQPHNCPADERFLNFPLRTGSKSPVYSSCHRQEALGGSAAKTGETKMIRKSFITAVSAVAIAASAAPAMSDEVIDNQFGFGHAAGGNQLGWNNLLGVDQNGNFSPAVGQQCGGNNVGAIGQQGNNNYADTWQDGWNNAAGVGQFGDNHNAILTQDG